MLVALLLFLSASASMAQSVEAEMDAIMRDGTRVLESLGSINERVRLAERLRMRSVLAEQIEKMVNLEVTIRQLVARAERVDEVFRNSGLGTSPQLEEVKKGVAQNAQLTELLKVGSKLTLGAYAAAIAGAAPLEQSSDAFVSNRAKLLASLAGILSQDFTVARKVETLSADRPDLRFYVETARTELKLLRDPDMGLEEFLAEHERAWKVYQEIPLDRISSWVLWASRYWVLEMDRHLDRLPAGSPERNRLAGLMNSRLQHLAAQAQRGLAAAPMAQGQIAYDWHPEMTWNQALLLVELARTARERADLDAAQNLLTGATSLLQSTRGVPSATMVQQIFGQPVDLEAGFPGLVEAKISEEKARLLMQQQEGVASAPTVDLLARALQLYAKAEPAEALNLVGEYAVLRFKVEGQRQAVEPLLDNALTDSRSLGNRRAEMRNLLARGELKLLAGDKAGGIADLQAGITLLEQAIIELGGGIDSGRRLKEEVRHYYSLLASEQAETNPAQALGSLARMQQLELIGNVPAPGAQAAAAAQDLRASQRRLDALEQQNQNLTAVSGASANEMRRQVQGQTAQARDSVSANLNQLKARFGKYYDRLVVQPLKLAEIQGALPPDTVVMQVLATDDKLQVFVVSNSALVMRSGYGNQREVGYLARALARKLASKSAGYEKLSQELYRKVIEPALGDLAGKKRIVFIPTGSLGALPLQVAAHSVDGKLTFLVEDFQLLRAVRFNDLKEAGKPTQKGLVLVAGNPDGSLPAAEKEAKQLGTLFPSSQVLVGAQASKNKLLELQPQVRILHLATHGIVNVREPDSSYLLLAGSGDASRLTVTEIAQRKFDPDSATLTTLSACETAVAPGRSGDNSELRSLADAFRAAGCPTLVASLWKVNDESTAALMIEFYKLIAEGRPKDEAFRAAQLKMLTDERFNHPHHWAPFVMIGDWR